MLERERSGYRLMGSVSDSQVPATVQAVLAARIDRLPAEEKRLLQVAAVIGKDVPDTLLRAVADRSEDDLRRGLAGLQAAEFLYEVSLFPELEYTFKHALTHEVAYGGLLQERRRTLHGQVVEAIERLHADRLDEHLERLAHHAMRAEAWWPAVTYGRRAGLRALAQAAHRDAATHLEQALSALGQLPVTRETLDLGLDLRIDIRSALDASSRPRELLGYLREAEQIAQQLGDQRRLSGVYAMMSHVHLTLGEHDQSLEASQRAHELAEQIGDTVLQVSATLRLSRQYAERGELRRGTATLRSRLGLLEGLTETPAFGYPASEQRAHYISEIARELGELGEVDDALAHGEEAVRWADASGKAIPMGVTRNILGLVFLERGEIGRAFPLVERGRAVLEAAEILEPVTWSLALLGAATTLAGRAGEGAALLEQALELADRVENTYGEVRWTVWLAEAYLAAGLVEDARRLATHGLALARTRHVPRNEPYGLRALGEIAASGEPPALDEAEARYCEALAIAERQEQRPIQAHCHLGLGKLYRRVGRPDEARVELATAVAMLREMGMTFWLPEAESELAQVDTGRTA